MSLFKSNIQVIDKATNQYLSNSITMNGTNVVLSDKNKNKLTKAVRQINLALKTLRTIN